MMSSGMDKLEKLKESFLLRSRKRHGDRYVYDMDSYKQNGTIRILCQHHGWFEQNVNAHASGRCGCPKCGLDKQKQSLVMTHEKFVGKCTLLYGDTFDFSETKFIDMTTPVSYTCKVHGVVSASPRYILNGLGCKKCSLEKKNAEARHDTNWFISESKRKFGDAFSYDKSVYVGAHESIIITCKEYGDFETTPAEHLKSKTGRTSKLNNKQFDDTYFLSKFTEKHKNLYSYTKTKNIHRHGSITCTCQKHGDFEIKTAYHLNGGGCPMCAKENSSAIARDRHRYNKEKFVELASEIHGDRYNYDFVEYIDSHTKVGIVCKTHGLFYTKPHNHLNSKSGCPACISYSSRAEQEIYDFLISNGVTPIRNKKEGVDIFEYDLFLPDKKIAIEHHGLYWHSDKFKDDNYHKNKRLASLKNGVRVIQIFSDEWTNKRDICESMLLNRVGICKTKIYARKCSIVELTSDECNIFLEKNHMQGMGVNAGIRLGLRYGNELVSVMTFCNYRRSLGMTSVIDGYELLRFSNKLNVSVIGGASRLFSYFRKKYSPTEVTSFCNLRWGEGKMYTNIGMVKIKETAPNYYYTKGSVREERFKFTKHKLVEMGHSEAKTEREIMQELGYFRVYDCGHAKYLWTDKEKNKA